MSPRPLAAVLGLVVFLALAFGAASFGARFTPGEWYAALEKPPWNPPAWIFGPVWTVLYVLIAVAGHWLWLRRDQPGARAALALWTVQLVLNALWSWIFFGLHRMGLALAELGLLWLAILATILAARRVRPLAAGLLIPYLVWVSFAWFLNLTLWNLNA